jgi:oligopeptide transport system substrate-binding protein
LDRVELLIPQFPQNELKHYREVGQLHISPVPFVDAIHFVTDREKLALEIEYQLPATGGYLPPGLPGHSPDNGLPYDPQEARRIMAEAGYPQGRGFPPVSLLLGLVGLEKGDNLVFAFLQEMWERDLGVTIQRCWGDSANLDLGTRQDFNFFFIGWLADFPDPAAFLQKNFLIDQSHWHNPIFEALIEEGRHTLDQGRRVDLYRQADHILTEEAVILPLFYGHIYELRQPWVHKLTGSSIYSPQWKDITLMPH